jgi:predicted extracellular nuclease
MKMTRLTIIGISLIATFVLLPGQSSATTIAGERYLAFWNVENLFDTHDDPLVQRDEEFTPGSDKQWTEERLQRKIKNLARVIQGMNDNRGPDILGVCEVENRAVIEALLTQLGSLGRNYQIIHQDSPSGRGIDCAIIYDDRTVGLKARRFLFVDAGNTRDIVEAQFSVAETPLYVFVNHWPSKRNPASARMVAAKTLRHRIDEILRTNNSAEIVVMGDLNDSPAADSIQQHLNVSKAAHPLPPGALFNTTWSLYTNADQGTCVYDNRWQVIDQIIISPGLLDGVGLTWKPSSTQAVVHQYQLLAATASNDIPRPRPSYTWDDFDPNGYSDHLPISCVIQF